MRRLERGRCVGELLQEVAEAGDRLACCRARENRICIVEGGAQRDTECRCVFGQPCHRGVTDAPSGHIDDATQGDVVTRVGDRAEIRQRVLDLLAVIEAGAADDAVGDVSLPERLFHRTGLRIRAVEHGDVAQRAALPDHA